MCIPIWWIPVGFILLAIGVAGHGMSDDAREDKKAGNPWKAKALYGLAMSTIYYTGIAIPLLIKTGIFY